MSDTIVANVSTTAFVTLGASVTSAIDTLGDHDWFKVNLSAGQTYIFNVDASAAFIDSYLSVRNSLGTELAFNDDIVSGINRSSQVVFTPTTSGVFFLDVSGFNESFSGGYTLRAATLPTYTIDQIASYLIDGGVPGSGFHFATTSITYNVQGLTVAEQSLARLALQAWDEVGNFTFVETTLTAQISFTDAGSNIAQTSSDGIHATVQISSDWNSGITAINSYSFQTYLHEIGHALGLGHGGPYNGTATYGVDNIYTNDSWANSVMSYFTQLEAGTGTYDYVMGPQLADIVAIANLYGASTTTRSGDTTYGFHSNASQLYHFDDAIYGALAPALTLFDNGGNDTLDVSGYSQAQRIDLNAETHSDVGGELNNIAIARGSIIENAIGGSGSDSITGNAADNLLSGGGGNDTLNGGTGNDTLIGGVGDDKLFGGVGTDLLSGGLGSDQLLGDGAFMPTENAATINRLYLATLARGPDDSGLAYWTDQLNAGTSLISIAFGFVNSPEFQVRYGLLSNTQFVTLLYNNVLHRAPDAGGLANWLGMLNSGASRASVVTGFSESPEFVTATDPELHAGQVYRLYGATLARQPDAGGFVYWSDAMDSGLSVNAVAVGFVNSTEFQATQATYGALTNSQFVTLLYNNVLHRAPDAGGFASWVDQLNSGTSRTSVVTGFSESAEYQSSTSSAFLSYMRTVQPSWNDVIDGGAGNDIVSGGHGSDTYTFRASEVGTDQVYRFESWDTLQFVGFGYVSSAAAISHMSQSGANVLFVDRGETVTFHGATLADMANSTIIFG